MNKLFFAALMACTLTVFAQKPPIKFGDVPVEQIKMTHYEKDSSASAVILADYGASVLEYDQTKGFVLNFERITRIKILTKDGLDRANFSIPLYHDGSSEEKIYGLKAVTYNLENGKVVESKMKNDASFKEVYDANLNFLKLALPNVKVGSVIEITYEIRSDFVFNFQDWAFQDNIPVVWSEYRARIPEYFTYEKYVQGYISMHINEKSAAPNFISITTKERSDIGSTNVTKTTYETSKIDFTENRFRWVAKDVPAFKSEPFMTTYRDYISKINFELANTKFPNTPMKVYMGTWEDINKQYAESADFGGEVTGNGFLKRTVEEVVAGLSTPEEKMNAIFNYVKQTMTWDGSSRKFVTSSLRNVLEKKNGNCAEINLLLASMLEKAELNVSPVLLSTRDHGFVRESTPISSQFNYVICLVKVGEKSFMLDATEKLLPIGMLPERCLNGNGFVVSKSGFQWTKLQSSSRSRTVVVVDLPSVSAEELKGKLQIDRTGYGALKARKKYQASGEAQYVKDFIDNNSWEFTKSGFENVKEIQQTLKESHDIIIKDHVSSAGDILYISPFILFRESENPFKLEKREYPVDFGSAFDVIYTFKIAIPDTHAPEEIPVSKAFMLPSNAGKYFYSSTVTGSTITITSSLSISKSLFTQEEYPNLREFYNQVVAKQAEQIVLKKK